MKLTAATLRSRLAKTEPYELVQRAVAMLDSQGLHSSSINPVRNTAEEVLRLWATREKISRYRGNEIPGVAYLNSRLGRLLPEAPVDQYNFSNETSAGSIFIDPATSEFLGDTIVKRRPKSREMLDLEAQLFQPSRKSA
jgi:hypothetical protein